jgi:aryl-alcohol dehydrogenase-like predicted oxidoreductase
MKMKELGQTGIKVGEYGLGTWAMGGGIYGKVDDEESIRTLHRAQELGVNFLDTAPMYSISRLRDGRAEEVIGRAFGGGRRDRWVIATKYGRHLSGHANWKEQNLDFSGARARTSVEESLRRMRTDYLDVLFVHSPPKALFNPEDAFGEMQKLKAEGKIRAVGFSFWEKIAENYEQVAPHIESGVVEVVQVILSLLRPEAIRELFPLIRKARTGVVAREVLANGFLTQSFTAQSKFDEEHNKSRMPEELIRSRLQQAEKYLYLVDAHPGVHNLAEAALVWARSYPETSCVIPGAKTVAELEQCLASVDAEPYQGEILRQAEATHGDFAWTPNPPPVVGKAGA